MGLPKCCSSKESTCHPMQEMHVPSLGQEDPLEKKMATHSSVLAWAIPWTGKPGGLLSVGSRRVGHHGATERSMVCICIWCTRDMYTKMLLRPVCRPGSKLELDME